MTGQGRRSAAEAAAATTSARERQIAPQLMRRRACSHCVRRRTRCDDQAPCQACRLHNTQDTCEHGTPATGVRARETQVLSYQRACQNCRKRKTKCDRGFPCSMCVSQGKQSSCYAEQGGDRIQLLASSSSLSTSSASSVAANDEDTSEPQHSNRACFNCWYRKNRCNKRKPCSSCVFHACVDSCFIELEENNRSSHSANARRTMMEKRRQRAEARTKASTSASTATTITSGLGQVGAGGGGSTDAGFPSIQTQGGGFNEIPMPSVFSRESVIADAVARLPPLHNVIAALALIGDFSLANDWPTVDRDVLQVTFNKLHEPSVHGTPDAIELAYVFALLAVCTIALPQFHPYKMTGACLHPSLLAMYVSATTTLMDLVTHPTYADNVTTAVPLLECRVFHALAWSSSYGGRVADAHYFSEQSVLSARMANILNGFPGMNDDVDSYHNPDRAARTAVLDLVLEVSSLANWVSFAVNAPSSIPPLPADLRKYALLRSRGVEEDVNALAATWRAWKVHSSGWMGRTLGYLRETNAKRDDGTLVLSSTERNAYATRLMAQMEQEENEIDAHTALLRSPMTAVEAATGSTPPLENAVQMRRTNAKTAAQLTTYVLRHMLASHAFMDEQLDVNLSRTALLSAQRILANIPTLLSLLHSQYHFPPLQLFLSRIFEGSMQATHRALCRLHEVQQDATMAAQTAWLIRVVPHMYDLMNSRGVAGPTALTVLSMCRSLPIHRAPVGLLANTATMATIPGYWSAAGPTNSGEVPVEGATYATSAVATMPSARSTTSAHIEPWDESVHGHLYQ